MAKKRVILALFLVLIALIIIFLPGISRYHRIKARQGKLEDKIERLKKSEVDLRREQERLQEDPTYIEKVAREKLQVTKKGETIVRVEGSNAQ
ncbi:MAG: hypothetical protein AMJ78_07835 [Omnitrophica WOR_2 bacterium SM23_29]|nr:MAG: hypothetical protein AMJ78_07835 [Omnitrophica WOR_2 bacterium SM23_29]